MTSKGDENDAPDFKRGKAFLELSLCPEERKKLHLWSVRRLGTRKELAHWQNEHEGEAYIDALYVPAPKEDFSLIVNYGFASQLKHLKFGVYYSGPAHEPGDHRKYRAIVCRVAVGKSLTRTESDIANISELPEGFASIYVPSESTPEAPAKRIGGMGMPSFNDTYYIVDKGFAIPMFLLEYNIMAKPFERQGNLKEESKTISCELCLKATAVSFCEQCGARFCTPCDRSMHASVFMKRHRRVPVSPKKKGAVSESGALCSEHGKESNRFCWTCGRPVCSSCTSHSRHAVLTTEEAMGRVSREMAELHDIREQLKQTIEAADEAKGVQGTNLERHSALLADSMKGFLKDSVRFVEDVESLKFELLREASEVDRHEDLLQGKVDNFTKLELVALWRDMQPLRSALHQRVRIVNQSAKILTSLPLPDVLQRVRELEKEVSRRDRVIQELSEELRRLSASKSTG